MDFSSNNSFALSFPCPGAFDKEGERCENIYQDWHCSCSTKSFINLNGDVFCENFKNKKGGNCSPYFIQDAGFKCKSSFHGQEFKKFLKQSELLQAMVDATKTIENS